MPRIWSVVVCLVAVAVLAAFAPQGMRRGQTIIVRMVDKTPTEFLFEPAEISVQPGDTVRFLQTGTTPHNVEFTAGQSGAELGDMRMGPFLLQAGETYDVVIDEQFRAGQHTYVCTPHAALGMVGAITVVAN